MFRPFFRKGSILKQHMLESLRDFPYTVLDIDYNSYGDGIITGFDVSIDNGACFRISPGIIKLKGEIYVSSQIITIDQKDENHFVYLTINKEEIIDGEDISVKIEQIEEISDCSFELFRYTKNAEMFFFKNIGELFNAPINRVNQLHCKYSVIGGSTFLPYYYKLFAESLLESENASASDIAFAFQCLNGINNIDVVTNYFRKKLTNTEILKEMKSILDGLQKKTSTLERAPEKQEVPRKMEIS